MQAVSPNEWQSRIDQVWEDTTLTALEVVTAISSLVLELPANDPRGPFELAGAHDSAGNESLAAEHYERAIELGLSGQARAQLDIQYASTLRNLGRFDEAVAILARPSQDPELSSTRRAFLALALHSQGHTTAALAVVLEELVPHLPRYQRSLTGYTSALRDSES